MEARNKIGIERFYEKYPGYQSKTDWDENQIGIGATMTAQISERKTNQMYSQKSHNR